MGSTGGSPIFRNTAGCRPHYILPLILLTLCILLQHSSPDTDGENAPGAPAEPSRDPRPLSKVIKAAETGLPAHQYNDISIFQNNLGACATQLSLGENRQVEHGITPKSKAPWGLSPRVPNLVGNLDKIIHTDKGMKQSGDVFLHDIFVNLLFFCLVVQEVCLRKPCH